ncbi:RNA polymerase II transcription factor B subunit 4 [Tilletia horrida]|uniref:General transcription and DNA repair factor IIH subunit TFB4 n=1 Tax=Tilletia horrida TaxID=155126 RepID=A0AAN6JVQ3_9BASI|nr:RNA polymerase II transcription factor B subunit 4 [Tilletia horrida]
MSSTSTAAPAASSSSTKPTGASSSVTNTAPTVSQPDFLVVILELDPALLVSPDTPSAFTASLLPPLLIFLNAHIALQHGNGLAIYLACPHAEVPTSLVYTSAPTRLASSPQQGEQDLNPDPNTYQHFATVNRALWAAVRKVVQDVADPDRIADANGEDDDDEDEHSVSEDEGERGEDGPLRKRQRTLRKARNRRRTQAALRSGTGPLVSALSQALAHLNNIPPSSSSSTTASAATQSAALPSGHSASILPKAASSSSTAAATSTSNNAGASTAGAASGGLSSWRPRILIMSTLDGSLRRAPSGQSRQNGSAETDSDNGKAAMAYVPLMNCIFAAQKRGILIDVIKLTQGQDVVFLQQAAHLTGGNYLRLDLDEKGEAPEVQQNPQTGSASSLSLLQVLMTTFLPPRDLRYFPPSLTLSSSSYQHNANAEHGAGVLRLPTLDSVDFRAACFCHRTVVDIGFVCSVCLSIFCEPRKQCLICSSRFPRATIRRFGDESKISAAVAQHTKNSSSKS